MWVCESERERSRERARERARARARARERNRERESERERARGREGGGALSDRRRVEVSEARIARLHPRIRLVLAGLALGARAPRGADGTGHTGAVRICPTPRWRAVRRFGLWGFGLTVWGLGFI